MLAKNGECRDGFPPALPLVYSKTEPFDQSLEDIHRRLQQGQFKNLVRLVRLVDRTRPHHQGLQPQQLQPGYQPLLDPHQTYR